MTRSVGAILAGLILSGTASAGVLATGIGFAENIGAECEVANIGTKPVTVTSVSVIDGTGAVRSTTSNCTFPGQIFAGLMCGVSVTITGADTGLKRYLRCVIVTSSKSNIRGTMRFVNASGEVVLDAH